MKLYSTDLAWWWWWWRWGSSCQSCPTLRPHGCSPPGSSVHGIFQARIMYQVAISFYSTGDRPDPGMEAAFPALAYSLPLSHLSSPAHLVLVHKRLKRPEADLNSSRNL